MKKVLILLSLILFALGICIGLNVKQSEINRYQLQDMFPNSKIIQDSIPKALIDTKTGDVWVLITKNGFEWRQIRNANPLK